MKTIGLLGGLSWESTVPYYRIINEAVRAQLGGLHSARIVLYSFDFDEVAALQKAGEWDASTRLLGQTGAALKAAGADCIAICTNTMHRHAAEIEQLAGIPLLHIADAAAGPIRAAGLRKVGLLGTRFTMEDRFYQDHLLLHGIEAIVPDEAGREIVHRVIYEELCQGIIRAESRTAYQAIVAALAARGAEGIVLGCTEIPMLLQAGDCALPLFDTGLIHAGYIARWALADH
ncbi:aspartate/glutamate racemase family protein [Uliginosibacterium sp. 31-16]|uniref:aspartate/glutamate racemase family protein n=1 Tax=Uliginosibacterium sp. 31-16 TaxID=3068315 RepID=UPI00273ECDD5|nr:aspartate/glutamate racemase family protein [Uliginosibacterium sp. 31-16]MDP5239174.1 aspartate/glutamate racemase family protein [Uliginosibacterium sp. 31-16]